MGKVILIMTSTACIVFVTIELFRLVWRIGYKSAMNDAMDILDKVTERKINENKQ